jgi:glutamate/tyrosine decarboxylase-like PLP-dependent enzyme
MDDLPDDTAVLDLALAHAHRWLESLPDRRIPATGTADDAAARLGTMLPARGAPAAEVIDRLAAAVEPGLMANASGRFYGWVMGAALPSAMAADWLVAAWDQNAGMRAATPGVVAVEEVAAAWLLEVLGLPRSAAVGFTTGATMANFTCLAAARGRVLAGAGWDVDADGLAGAPRVRVLVGAESHSSVELALRYLGLGRPETVACDAEGRLDAAALRSALDGGDGPAIVCLQAGNIHSGAFDPFRDAVGIAHDAGAWVHVDGAFGLWAAAAPRFAVLTNGAVVADAGLAQRTMGVHASYLLTGAGVDPFELVPEMSRRARGVPVWAALASLGSDGVRDLLDGLHTAARDIAAGLATIPGVRVLNDVVYTQVTVAFESEERTREVHRRLLAEGRVMPSASVWHGGAVIRFSVSSWRTGPAEVRETVEAVARAATAALPAAVGEGAR